MVARKAWSATATFDYFVAPRGVVLTEVGEELLPRLQALIADAPASPTPLVRRVEMTPAMA